MDALDRFREVSMDKAPLLYRPFFTSRLATFTLFTGYALLTMDGRMILWAIREAL